MRGIAQFVLGIVFPGAIVVRQATGDRHRAAVGGGHHVAAHREQVATQVQRGRRRVGRDVPRGPLRGIDQGFQRACFCVQTDDVTFAQPGQRATAGRFRGQVDGGGNLARCAGQAAVGHQRHAAALVLQQAEQRGQRMQFRHAVRTRALIADDGDEILRQRAGGMQFVERARIVDDHGGRLDVAVFRLHRRGLDQRAPQVAAQQAQAALGFERTRHRAHHVLIGTLRDAWRIGELAILQARLVAKRAHAAGHDGGQVVHQAGVEQFAEDELRTAGRGEPVHVGFAVRIDTRQQRHGLCDQVHVVPGQDHACRTRDRDPVDGVVGGTARRHQGHHRVDDGPLVDQAADRPVVVAQCGDAQGAFGRGAGQHVAQGLVGVDEGRARQLQAHRFQQHLVGIGGAIERAGAGSVITGGLGLQQLFARGFAGGVALAHRGLFLVGDARRHRAGRHEHRRQVAEGQRADQQAGDDLVAHAQVQRGVEHVVAQRDRRGLRDHIAREQRQLHARTSLGDAVAHRRHAAGHLRGGAHLAGERADDLGVMLERLVRREHVVVRVDDAEVGRDVGAQPSLVGRAAGGEGMRQVAAAQARALRTFAMGGIDAVEVGAAQQCAALADAFGDFLDAGVQAHGRRARLQTRTFCMAWRNEAVRRGLPASPVRGGEERVTTATA